jgi:DNA-binding MarR family transcriptional regulator
MHDFNAYVRTTGLSFIQMNALIHVFYRGPREVLDFAEFMRVTPAGASQMVERMVQQGWVRREEAPADRRVRLVHLTEQGRELVEAGIAARQRWIAELAGTLTEEEREAVAAALQILAEKAVQFERS